MGTQGSPQLRCFSLREAQLRRQVRSQVQLGNEGDDAIFFLSRCCLALSCCLIFPRFAAAESATASPAPHRFQPTAVDQWRGPHLPRFVERAECSTRHFHRAKNERSLGVQTGAGVARVGQRFLPVHELFLVHPRPAAVAVGGVWRISRRAEPDDQGTDAHRYAQHHGTRDIWMEGKTKTFPIAEESVDDVGTMLYHLRAIPWNPGERCALHVYESDSEKEALVECQAANRARLGVWPNQPLLRVLALPGKGTHHRGRLMLWMTDDARRLPVHADLEFRYGTFSIDLIRPSKCRPRSRRAIRPYCEITFKRRNCWAPVALNPDFPDGIAGGRIGYPFAGQDRAKLPSSSSANRRRLQADGHATHGDVLAIGERDVFRSRVGGRIHAQGGQGGAISRAHGRTWMDVAKILEQVRHPIVRGRTRKCSIHSVCRSPRRKRLRQVNGEGLGERGIGALVDHIGNRDVIAAERIA